MKSAFSLAAAIAAIAIAGSVSSSSIAAPSPAMKLEQVAPPRGGNWSQVVNPSPQGGFVMGNPGAPVKLIEYGSMTCPHCRHFDETGVPSLIENYVKSGRVSWEFRNYVRDAFDLTAALVARCNGARSFFPLARGLYKQQPVWLDKFQTVPQPELERLQNLPPKRQFIEIAKLGGFQLWAAARGLPVAKSNQCLTNQNAVNQLVQMTGAAATQFPNFQGTPTFVINGRMVEKAATWEALEPALRAALGRG
jgi:protein-disulfide isomerase